MNTSIVAGGTTIGGVAGYALLGPVGIGFGMLGGAFGGTYVKRQDYFGFNKSWWLFDWFPHFIKKYINKFIVCFV